MHAKVMIEPSARVETPEIAWPMVQPSAVMPPKPISIPPTTWLAVSAASRKPSQRNVRVAKAYAAEVGLDATTRALQLAGGRGILKELPLERWHRDALAGPVMPPSNDRCLETAGKLLCGLRAATLEFQ